MLATDGLPGLGAFRHWLMGPLGLIACALCLSSENAATAAEAPSAPVYRVVQTASQEYVLTANSIAPAAGLPVHAVALDLTRPGSLQYAGLAADSILAGRGQADVLGSLSPVPVSLRLGAMVSPRTKFAAGIDVTIPGLHLFPSFQSRVDLDVIASANFGGINTLVPITFDQIYGKGLVAGSRLYAGGGLGMFIGSRTRFGGKLIAGGNITQRIGVELNVDFAGTGTALIIVQARLGL